MRTRPVRVSGTGLHRGDEPCLDCVVLPTAGASSPASGVSGVMIDNACLCITTHRIILLYQRGHVRVVYFDSSILVALALRILLKHLVFIEL